MLKVETTEGTVTSDFTGTPAEHVADAVIVILGTLDNLTEDCGNERALFALHEATWRFLMKYHEDEDLTGDSVD